MNQKGFTLLELMATLVIMGVFASVVVHKYERLSDQAIEKEFLIAVRELNVRESLTYYMTMISGEGYQDDDTLFAAIDFNLGAARWSIGPTATGGQLRIQGLSKIMARTASTKRKPAAWNF